MTVYKGWNAKIYINIADAGYVEVGYAESASVEISSNLEGFYEIGSRVPTDLQEGNQEVTGSLSKAWIDSTYLDMIVGSTTITEFDLAFNVHSSAVILYCYACKFETGSVDVPQDGFLKEDYDFRAKTVAVV